MLIQNQNNGLFIHLSRINCRCVHIGRSQTITTIICGLSSGKRFVKLSEVF